MISNLHEQPIKTVNMRANNLSTFIEEPEQLATAYQILNVFTHKDQVEIIRIISQYKIIKESELFLQLEMEPSDVLQHLDKLCQCRILTRQQSFKSAYYSLNRERIQLIGRYARMFSNTF